jgi:hypothetical protein
MRPEEIRKLIGGYATGTLTEAEREALFAAALDDQELFNELAGEESLRELLSDPGARAEMLAAVEPKPRVWAWWRPAVAALAVATIGTVMVLLPRKKVVAPPAPTAPTIVAEVKPSEVKPPPPPTAEQPAAPKRARKSFQAPAAPPPAPASTATLAEAPKAEKQGVAGGTPGGVLGGIVNAPPLPSFRNSFSTAESVQVTAEAALVRALSARALFFRTQPVGLRVQSGALAGVLPPQQNLGIRYSVVRDDDAGTVTLRITANANGFVSVAGGEPVALTAMRPYTTAALTGSEVRVVFARTPEKALTGPVAVLTETVAGEVYVVTATPATEIGVTVPLSPR